MQLFTEGDKINRRQYQYLNVKSETAVESVHYMYMYLSVYLCSSLCGTVSWLASRYQKVLLQLDWNQCFLSSLWWNRTYFRGELLQKGAPMHDIIILIWCFIGTILFKFMYLENHSNLNWKHAWLVARA